MRSVEELVVAAAAGDRDALAELLCHEHIVLQRRLGKRIPWRHRKAVKVEDLLQVTYLEAHLRVTSFDGRGSAAFRRWLNRIGDTILADAVRELDTSKRLARPSSPDQADRPGSETAGPPGSRLASGSHDEAKAQLEAAIRRLPPDYARVVREIDLDGRSALEVAADMNRAVGAIYMLKGRARALLLEMLGDTASWFKS